MTKYQIGHDIASKTDSPGSIFDQVTFIWNQFGRKVLTIHSDGDTSLGNDFTAEIQSKGMRFEPTPPYQPEQNPYAERYGAMVSAMARQMTNDANLPAYLWNEAAKAAIYIQNRIPHRTIR